ALQDDPRFKPELPASQIEIVTPVCANAAQAAAALLEARRELVQRTQDLVHFACAGVHPFSSGMGDLNKLPRYARTIEEYGSVASRQLVCALQVHVAVGGAERTLAVYN